MTEIISNSTTKEIRYSVEFLTSREEGKESDGPSYLKRVSDSKNPYIVIRVEESEVN